jgi:hypothetical protein
MEEMPRKSAAELEAECLQLLAMDPQQGSTAGGHGALSFPLRQILTYPNMRFGLPVFQLTIPPPSN